ncbi:uncharacterized protein ASCRUDRAFT_10527 [Ascoidea rubescens DSM 1968]|uniref:Uncharacterized protein n=1 Tax=Ascoidea rubescens DSM 1968 TaxID=1344418 RepID=A0A1D2V8W2_9ASCO|nr:hypothetical protein ASCRUDRAFT_10527 [Ascoidea rubescens DSM 1968]ODV58058.1 hypothetical protein ASCRUDRAFT_10527 [Ascoidea rubescens DSM 1968]
MADFQLLCEPNESLPYYSDKVILSDSVLNSLLTKNLYGSHLHSNNSTAASSPLIFKITVSVAQSQYSTFVGVREFSAPDDVVYLPGIIQERLHINGSQRVSVSPVTDVPKGSSLAVSYQDDDAEENDNDQANPINISSIKYFLEANLMKYYTTLTKNESLKIYDNNLNRLLVFKITDTSPSDTICIIDTNLIFDLQFKNTIATDNNNNNNNNDNTSNQKIDKIIPTNELPIKKIDDFNSPINLPLNSLSIQSISLQRLYQFDITSMKKNFKNLKSFYLLYSIKNDLNLNYDKSQIDQLLNNLDFFISNDKFVSKNRFIWSSLLSSIIFNQSTNLYYKFIKIDLNDTLLVGKDSLYIFPSIWDQSLIINHSNINISFRFLENTSDYSETIQNNINIDTDDAICSNCGKQIPKRNIAIHETFCFRNNIKCPNPNCPEIISKKQKKPNHWHCDKCTNFLNEFKILGNTFFQNSNLEFFKAEIPSNFFSPLSPFLFDSIQFLSNYLFDIKNFKLSNLPLTYSEFSLQKHDHIFHQNHKCLGCSKDFDNLLFLSYHKAIACPSALHECKFCHLILPRDKSTYEDIAFNLSHHELSVCGSKTIQCFTCFKYIKQLNYLSHMKLHDIKTIEKIKSNVIKKCLNKNCINLILINEKRLNNNDLQLCDVCFGPSYSTLDDPHLRKIKNSFERRYVLQLTKGCGNSFCKNPECISSGSSSSLKYKTFKDKFQHILNDLMVSIPKIGNGKEMFYYFCVREDMTKKKMLADIAYEDLKKTYHYIAVCEAVHELSRAKTKSKFGGFSDGDAIDLSFDNSHKKQQLSVNNIKKWLARNGLSKGET